MSKFNKAFLAAASLLGAAVLTASSGCSPRGDVGRRAGLWISENHSEGVFLPANDQTAQRVPSKSTGRYCIRHRQVENVTGVDGPDVVWRTIEVPEEGMVVSVQVPKNSSHKPRPVLVTITRKTSDSLQTEGVMVSRTDDGTLVSVSSEKHLRLGDCPPGMKPSGKLVQAK